MKSVGLTPHEARMVEVFRALGNPARFRILRFLAEQNACVCGNIVDALPLAQSTVSEHLKVLKDAGLIKGTISGPATCYCIDTTAIREWQARVAGLITERSIPMTEDIHQAVSERYAAIATGGINVVENDYCCGEGQSPDSCGTGYTEQDLAGLPSSVTGVSLGCGNPVGLADVKPGETVLDLGSGGGIDCFIAAQRVGPEGRVIGVDMTPDMIHLARANAEKVGAQNVEFRLGEIEHLPVDAGSVDLVISNCVVNLAPDKAAVYREVNRVLRPGGRLVISDTVAEAPVPDELKARLDLWSSCASGSLDRETYFATLKDAGFDRIEVVEEHPTEKKELEISSLTLRAFKG
jgi:arsenite methyltransferase